MISEPAVSELVATIKGHGAALDSEAQRLRSPEILSAFDKTSHQSWCLSAVGDSLIRLRQFTEQNFNYIETIGVVAVTRYIFEMSVWLRLFRLDKRYGLVYYSQLLDTQYRYWKDYRDHLKREIAFLREFHKKDEQALREVFDFVSDIADPEEQKEAALAAPKAISAAIDAQASRHFSIFAEQARDNGYGFQAQLVEDKVLPEVNASVAALEAEKAAFEARISKATKGLIPKRWVWRQMAQKVGLSDEHDFIYTYTSKLLHATPASITTDQKNLEQPEYVIFLKYISVKMVDVVELSREYPP